VQKANIYDLTRREGASLGLPHDELLIEALTAISAGKLQACFDAFNLQRQPPNPWTSVDYVVRQAISALERNPNFYVRWFRLIEVDPVDYRQWREQTSKLRGTKARVPRASDEAVRSEIKRYIADEQAKGSHANQKRAWVWIKARLPGATHKQVIQALSGEEGGKKSRGRPSFSRKSTES